MRVASVPAFLLSFLLHSTALAALLFFVHEAKDVDIDGTEHATFVVPAQPDPLERPSIVEDLEPAPDVRGGDLFPLLSPPPAPAEGVPPPAEGMDDLDPLEAFQVLDEGWRLVNLPLEVARQKIRLLRPIEEARETKPAPQQPSAPLRPASPAPRRRPAVLEPLHTPIFYPRAADRLGLRGVVVVAFTVHTSGAVLDARVRVSSGHALLDAAALASVRQWRFRSIPHNQRAEKPFRFKAP